MEYETVIGLEVHAHLLTKSKIFCGCSTEFGGKPNHHTCPICLGMPGVLPVLNNKAVEFIIRMALATHCQIANYSRFARKNYFYPDLPKGYQISQYELPVAANGYVEIDTEGGKKKIGLTRIHLEEDAGKLIHGENLVTEDGYGDPESSYVDFNRTGVPLIEIVSEPDMRSAEEAKEYLQQIKAILQYIEICDGNMEEGSLRCDANISLRPQGSDTFGTKTEIKNMNSFRNVQKALEYEAARQRHLLRNGDRVVQETRLWDAERNVTVSMRSKEEAHDYRYFPEPDLVPLSLDGEWIQKVKEALPELPEAKKERFIEQYQLPHYDAMVLTTSRALADYFEQCVALYAQPKTISNWIMSELLRELKAGEMEINQCPLSPQHLTDMIRLIEKGVISGKIAKVIFDEMFQTGKDPEQVLREKNLVQISDRSALESTIDGTLSSNAKEVQAFQAGKDKLFGFFVGEVMKATKGKANPQLVNEILREKLKAKP